MLQIFTHTPAWVWLLLIGLCVIGFHQTKARQVSVQRVLILPCIMLLLALHSIYTGLGSTLVYLVVWSVTACLTCLVIISRSTPSDHHYDHVAQKFTIAGSWQPLILMLGIFIAKYVMNVSLAIHPELMLQPQFALGFTIIFGIFNGAFLVRPLVLLKLKSQRAYSNTELAA